MGGTLLNVQLDIGMSPLGVSPVSDPGACRCPLRNAREQPINIFMGFGREWRKREGIEPSGDIAASRPDLKSGGATSAPSASVRGVRLDRRRNGMSAPRARGTGCLFLFRFPPAALPGLFLSLPATPDFPLPFRRHFFLRRVSA